MHNSTNLCLKLKHTFVLTDFRFIIDYVGWYWLV